MKKTLMVVSVLLLAAPVWAQKEKITSDSLKPMEKRFLNYERDFASFELRAVRKPGSLERELSGTLHWVASEAGEYLRAVDTVLSIYEKLSCETDKITVRALIRNELSLYVKKVNSLIEYTNLELSYTRVSAVATTAARMKDDLRDVKTVFESLQHSLQ